MAAVCLVCRGLRPDRPVQQAILQTIFQDTHTPLPYFDLILILLCSVKHL